jgi:hypothetical protein
MNQSNYWTIVMSMLYSIKLFCAALPSKLRQYPYIYPIRPRGSNTTHDLLRHEETAV